MNRQANRHEEKSEYRFCSGHDGIHPLLLRGKLYRLLQVQNRYNASRTPSTNTMRSWSLCSLGTFNLLRKSISQSFRVYIRTMLESIRRNTYFVTEASFYGHQVLFAVTNCNYLIHSTMHVVPHANSLIASHQASVPPHSCRSNPIPHTNPYLQDRAPLIYPFESRSCPHTNSHSRRPPIVHCRAASFFTRYKHQVGACPAIIPSSPVTFPKQTPWTPLSLRMKLRHVESRANKKLSCQSHAPKNFDQSLPT